LVRENDFKVVLTGEGADEILGGYDLFKETIIRAFWARNPDSTWRPALLRKLYPTLPVSMAAAGQFMEQFFKAGLDQQDKYYYSHMPRINTTSRIKAFFSNETKAAIDGHDSLTGFGSDLPARFGEWHPLIKAQFVEAKSLLAGYLLSSQGDRVGSANSVEGRFPFLDHRVVEFASTIPPGRKILGLNEKYLLKKAMSAELPPEVVQRVKQPYMAPDSNSFVQQTSPGYVQELLSEPSLADSGLFNPKSVLALVKKCRRMSDKHLSFKDNMSFVGILSTELLYRQFIDRFEMPSAAPRDAFTVWQDESQ
jgi:asparagine synthase (glutamine-hydrolysing)